MIDLHTHTTFSDGELIPSELVRRAEVLGYRAIGITDHADYTNIEHILSCVSKAKYMEEVLDIRILVGAELTHVPPPKIGPLASLARRLGAEIVVVHGETPVEPVRPGTNRAALEADVDILAHPGFITLEEAELARENNVCLEITSRRGHNITNGHVVRLAKMAGAKMIVNTDSHAPGDLISSKRAVEIAMGAGLTHEEAVDIVEKHAIISG
ncbi:MAG: histidinol phosphate phosphatase domain-containing protein [Methanothrix sp.]|jgi:histidinol phosphatase-like PHP family hydrolase|nr:histidinol phosphate phosphatase domain-containing protein [Methanothrix sp.]MDD1739683.1 histidinol phosphate phosphatase domain-containing protein [Methanothrix sp.]OYV14167.1 MAG: PHP domain-containing protein [Methanosaeta sp. NSM2]